jgi:hypothetical protein
MANSGPFPQRIMLVERQPEKHRRVDVRRHLRVCRSSNSRVTISILRFAGFGSGI